MKNKLLKMILAFVMTGMFAVQTNAAAIVPVNSNTENPVTEKRASAIKNSLKAFRNLPKKERRERVKEVKKEIKEFKHQKRNGAEPSTNTLLLVILAILLPPLAVYLHEGKINNKFWLSVFLTIIFWLPGVIYALIVILGDE